MSSLKKLKEKIEKVEADFVEHLLKTCVFGEEIQNTLSDEECKLMDDIIEAKEAILELLEEEVHEG